MRWKFCLLFLLVVPFSLGFEFNADPSLILETEKAYELDIYGKLLVIDKETLSDKDVTLTDEGLKIDGITIIPLEQEKIFVYYGKPDQEILDSNSSVVYIVEHYWPDLRLDDPRREEGWRRMTAVVKDASVEIRNGVVVRTDGLKIGKNSFFENSEDKEIDYLKKERLFEIYTQAYDLVVRTFKKFHLDDMLDRGYTGLGESRQSDLLDAEGYYDVVDGEKVE